MSTHTADGPSTMPSPPVRPTPLRCTAAPDGAHRVRLHVYGDLDYDNAERLLDAVREQLDRHPRDLHLHCAEVVTVDSMGLSVLLMVQRVTTAAGAHLHLEDRTPALDRLLQITGTLDHLTAPGPIPGGADRT
ncbi:STAS domain-containing protein [Streptomyces sp. NPDC091272]|uniref:STAS domain-containing protein n=1 Tax=Streptomyces sp. NPDC091272 TaxID=3365981 RepID=UPI0038307AF0